MSENKFSCSVIILVRDENQTHSYQGYAPNTSTGKELIDKWLNHGFNEAILTSTTELN